MSDECKMLILRRDGERIGVIYIFSILQCPFSVTVAGQPLIARKCPIGCVFTWSYIKGKMCTVENLNIQLERHSICEL